MNAVPYSEEYRTSWNTYLEKNPNSSVFHTLEWKDIIEKVYKFKPYYLLAMSNDKVHGVLCSFLTKGIFGKKIVSTPFNFYNQPLFDNDESGKKLIEHIISVGKQENVEYIELKALEKFNPELVSYLGVKEDDHYFISNLKLVSNYEEKYYPRLKKNLRTLKRNAEKENIRIRTLKDEDDLKQFYNILVRLYRDKHNMIPQPYALFYEMYKTFDKNFELIVAEHNNKVIAGMILLFFKKQVVYAYGASNQDYVNFSPGTLLVDETISMISKKGYETMDFGVTSPHQESLLEYKSNWGAEPSKLPYYYYLIRSDRIPKLDYHTSYRSIRKFFRYVPIPIVKILSPILTKRLG